MKHDKLAVETKAEQIAKQCYNELAVLCQGNDWYLIPLKEAIPVINEALARHDAELDAQVLGILAKVKEENQAHCWYLTRELQSEIDSALSSVTETRMPHRAIESAETEDTKRLDYIERHRLLVDRGIYLGSCNWRVKTTYKDAYQFVRENIIGSGDTLRKAIDDSMPASRPIVATEEENKQ